MNGEEEERWIILFDSIHHVIAAEEAFRDSGVWCDLAPVPRNLSSDCGMAVEFRGCDIEAVRLVVANLRSPPRSLWRPCSGGHEDVTEVLL